MVNFFNNTIEAIIFGFGAILNYKIMKRALMIGLVVTLGWSLIGYLLWDALVSFAAYFIDLVPFTMLRSNGAWILSSFLWFSLVLITFALILAFFGNMILERVSKEKYSSFSVLVVFVSAAFWSLIWFFQGSYIHTAFLRLLNWLPFQTVEASLSYLLGLYFIYCGIIVTMLLVTSFFSETLLEDIRDKHFPYEPFLEEDEIKELNSPSINQVFLLSVVLQRFLTFYRFLISLDHFLARLQCFIISDKFKKSCKIIYI